MLRILMAPGIILLALACAHKDAGKGLVKLSARGSNPQDEAGPLAPERSLDSTFYIGYVDYFPDTREFYTTLFHRDGFEYPDEDLLEARLDSVIAYEEDWGRERLPMDDARKFLILSGLDTLSIYNRNHELVCTTTLKRVEYLWDGLESYFVAVFNADGILAEQPEELYGMTAGIPKENLMRFASEEIVSSKLDTRLMQQSNINRSYDWRMRHYLVSDRGDMLSIASTYDLHRNEGASFLFSSFKGQSELLNEEINSFHFLNILPLPLQMNGKPLLLITAGYPSSDVLWDYLAGFDGEQYGAVEYNRIHLKNMPPRIEPLLTRAKISEVDHRP